jgi:hypothetical protein
VQGILGVNLILKLYIPGGTCWGRGSDLCLDSETILFNYINIVFNLKEKYYNNQAFSDYNNQASYLTATAAVLDEPIMLLLPNICLYLDPSFMTYK